MNFSERLNKEKLNESMEQEFGTTYKFKVKILFEGLDETELSGSIISKDPDKKTLETYVDERLKRAFNNIVNYEILELGRAEEQIFPAICTPMNPSFFGHL